MLKEIDKIGTSIRTGMKSLQIRDDLHRSIPSFLPYTGEFVFNTVGPVTSERPSEQFHDLPSRVWAELPGCDWAFLAISNTYARITAEAFSGACNTNFGTTAQGVPA